MAARCISKRPELKVDQNTSYSRLFAGVILVIPLYGERLARRKPAEICVDKLYHRVIVLSLCCVKSMIVGRSVSACLDNLNDSVSYDPNL